MRRNHNGFSVIELVALLFIVGLLVFTGWYVYKTKNNDGKGTDTQISTSSIPSGYKLYQNKKLGIQFLYTLGNGEPQVTESGPMDTQSGTEYSISQPNYGDASAVRVASKDFNLKLTGDEALLHKSFSLYRGDLSTDFKSGRKEVMSIDGECKEKNEIRSCTKIITNKPDEIRYISFDNDIAYLLTVKNLSSDKRLSKVVFGFRTDSGLVLKGTENYHTPISGLVGQDDYDFYNTVSNSLKAY